MSTAKPVPPRPVKPPATRKPRTKTASFVAEFPLRVTAAAGVLRVRFDAAPGE